MLKLVILQSDTQPGLIEYFDTFFEDLQLGANDLLFSNFHRDKGIYFQALTLTVTNTQAREIDKYFAQAYENLKGANYLSTSKGEFAKEQKEDTTRRWDIKV